MFRAFARAVSGGEGGFMVIDTAPTGHTLLLLDAAEGYRREVGRARGDVPDAVRRLLPRLRDAAFSSVVVVTVPEATPVHEARRLQEDLRRAGIEPFAWVVSQCLTPLGSILDPVLATRRRAEERFLREVEGVARRVHVVPWTAAWSEQVEDGPAPERAQTATPRPVRAGAVEATQARTEERT